MNKFAFSVVACLGLAACEPAPSNSITVSPEALARGDNITAQTVAPSVSPSVAISTFDTFCGRYGGNPAGTRAAVQSAGYFLLASMSQDGLEMYASDNGRPVVAIGRRDGAEVCMILIDEGASLDQSIASYVQQKHGSAAQNFGSMQFGGDTAENMWVVTTNPPIIYFTLVQSQIGLGRVEAIAMVTE